VPSIADRTETAPLLLLLLLPLLLRLPAAVR
jgi:hypothetical protein